MAIVKKTHPGYEYKQVPVQDEIDTEAQNYSNQGWETVSVIPPARPGLAVWLLVKRPKQNPYQVRPRTFEGEMTEWQAWEIEHGGVDWR